MESNKKPIATIDAYIAQYPTNVQEVLQQIRQAIRETAPDAEEKISYGMPTFYLNGNLIYFAANKNHIGIYPKTPAMESIEGLTNFKGTKGSVHFPLNQPMPLDLLRKIVQVRLEENQSKATSRPNKTAKKS